MLTQDFETYSKVSVVYLNFTLRWASCVLPGSPNPSLHSSHSAPVAAGLLRGVPSLLRGGEQENEGETVMQACATQSHPAHNWSGGLVP